MNISGKVLKANVVRGRDSYELELRVALKDGKANVYSPTSGYVGQLATVALVAVPPDYWDEDPGAPKPSPAAFLDVPTPPAEMPAEPKPAPPPKADKPPADKPADKPKTTKKED